MADQITTPHGGMGADEAADHVSAYVYGNIIVLAALASITPEEASHWSSLEVVLGAGLATFVAHVFSDLAGHRMRHGEHPSGKDLLHEAAIARPIVTSALLPMLVLAACGLGWIGGHVATPLALGVLALRLAWIGSVMTHRSGQHSSWRVVASGVLFGLAAVLVAVLKMTLSH